MGMEQASTPLAYGKLAPAFKLESVQGGNLSREQFRGKAGLLLIFFAQTEAITPLLRAVNADAGEYAELNAHILAIGGDTRSALETLAKALSFPVLDDHERQAWRAYTGLERYGYGVFVLDTYGGVEMQRAVLQAADLPSAAEVLEWVRGAQYKCNI